MYQDTQELLLKALILMVKNVKLRLKGLPAIVFQHEIDHLNGILFYDHINKENPMQEPENAIVFD